MLNIVIFSGGTGSVALQHGLDELLGNTVNLDIIINAYDNGKSTGACRKICGGSILGPSDLRKNQLTRFQIINKEKINDVESNENNLFNLFNVRLSAQSLNEYIFHAEKILNNAFYLKQEQINYLKYLIEIFNIQYNKNIKNNDISFIDFSLSNIFYSACAVENNSLRKAGSLMARILNIPDNVHLISDKNLYLRAVTNSGHIISDEGDIVCWNNPDDKIKDVFLTTVDGQNYIPEIDEENSINIKCKNLIERADIIIFSCGTQWSSLIPTYIHRGVRDAINSSSAKKYMIMNNCQDGDMYGINADGIYNIISRFLDLEDIYFIINKNASSGMNELTSSDNIILEDLSNIGDRKHIPIKLASSLIRNYYSINPADYHFFDLDGTLYQECYNGTQDKICYENLSCFPGDIITGNNIRHVKKVITKYCNRKDSFNIYFDFGNSIIRDRNFNDIKYISDKFFIRDNIAEILNGYDEYKGKVEVRGNVVITVKPLKNRQYHLRRIQDVICQFGKKYTAFISGSTSIDIMNTNYNKAYVLNQIIKSKFLDAKNIVFIGNEIDSGSEICIYESGIRTINVNDIYECNNYIRTLHYLKNGSILPAKIKKNLAIIFICSSDDYAFSIATSIMSTEKTNPDLVDNYIIFCDKYKLTKFTRNILLKVSQKIIFHDFIKEYIRDRIKISEAFCKRWTYLTYARVFCIDYLKQYRNVIIHGGDVIVVDDISDLLDKGPMAWSSGPKPLNDAISLQTDKIHTKPNGDFVFMSDAIGRHDSGELVDILNTYEYKGVPDEFCWGMFAFLNKINVNVLDNYALKFTSPNLEQAKTIHAISHKFWKYNIIDLLLPQFNEYYYKWLSLGGKGYDGPHLGPANFPRERHKIIPYLCTIEVWGRLNDIMCKKLPSGIRASFKTYSNTLTFFIDKKDQNEFYYLLFIYPYFMHMGYVNKNTITDSLRRSLARLKEIGDGNYIWEEKFKKIYFYRKYTGKLEGNTIATSSLEEIAREFILFINKSLPVLSN